MVLAASFSFRFARQHLEVVAALSMKLSEQAGAGFAVAAAGENEIWTSFF